MKKEYCFNCDKDVSVNIVPDKREYTVHNHKVQVLEQVHYCSICHSELMNDTLDEDLTNIYSEYLKIYNLSFDKFKEIRESLNLSQEQFAKVLGWSKKTVTRYENKQSLPQPEYLLVYKKILNNKMEFLKLLEERKSMLSSKEYYNILNKISFDVDIKTINVFLYILENNYLSITQIMKTFFAVDFESFKELKKSITGFQYARAPYGPIIDNKNFYLDSLIKSGFLEMFYDEYEVLLFKPCMEWDSNLFEEEEIEILKKVKNQLKGKSAKELTEWSHKFKGWINTENGNIINYKYAKEFKLDI